MVNPVNLFKYTETQGSIKLDQPEWVEKVVQIVLSQEPSFEKVKKINAIKSLLFHQDLIQKVRLRVGKTLSDFDQLQEIYQAMENLLTLRDRFDIKRYNITDEKDRIEIAKIEAEINHLGISQNIKNYNITDQSALIEIAKISARRNGEITSSCFTEFGITDEKSRIEIAKIVAEEDNKKISKYIKNFGITDQGALIQIAKLAAMDYSGESSRYINEYGIKDQEILIEIAKIALSYSNGKSAFYINEYRITYQQALIEMAKMAIKYSLGESVFYLERFGITDPKALYEIALYTAEISGDYISQRINTFGFKNERDRIEIAKIAAKEDGERTCFYIDKYEITDEKALVEIIKIALQNGSSDPILRIKEFKIKNHESRIEIAKIAAKFHGDITSRYITYFQITDQVALIDIAKLAAEKNGSLVSEYIKDYGITDEMALIEIAKIAAKQSGRGVSQFIKNYNILSERDRIEIAKIAINEYVLGTLMNIQDFEITDQNSLIELGKIAATRDPESTSLYIQKLKITSESARNEIAKIAARKNGREVSTYFKSYGITNPDSIREIFLKVLANSWENFRLAFHYETYDASGFLIGMLDPKIKVNYKLLEKSINEYKHRLPEFFEKWMDRIKANPHTMLEQNLIRWAALAALNLIDKKNLEPEIKPLVETSLDEIFSFRDPGKRLFLTHLLFQVLNNKEALKNWKKQGKGIHNRLPAIYLSLMDIEPHVGREFRDYQNMHPLIDVLDLLYLNKVLTRQEKEALLKNLTRRRLNEINALLSCNAMDQLRRGDLNFEGVLKKKLPLGDVQNVTEKFTATFGAFRDKTALFVYLGKIQEEKVKMALGTFVREVLEGRLQVSRYETEHLRTVFRYNESLKSKWTEGKQEIIETMGQSASSAWKAEDFKQFLITKLITDKHLEKIPEHLLKFLQGGSLKEALSEGDEFERGCLMLCNPVVGFVEKLKILKDLKCEGEFQNDINGLIENLAKLSTKNDYPGWKLVDSDDACDLFLSGTEVEGSCQRINGVPGNNKCLLAYVLDGKNRIFAIKDETGRMKARAMMRLLWDGRKPVLLMSRIYPSALNPVLQEALISFAKERALHFGIPLIGYFPGAPYTGVAESLGSPAPYEYVDEGDGVTDGKWRITGAKWLTE